MSKCAACQLPADQQEAIAAALRENVSLRVISDRVGLSTSAIFRHGKHVRRETEPTAPTTAVTRAPKVPALALDPHFGLEAKRQRAESRFARLWEAAMSGLEAATKPIRVGNVTIPPDLRSQVGFIRAGASITESQARLDGLFSDQQAPVNMYTAVILLPKLPGVEKDLPEARVVDALPNGSET